MWLIQWLKQNNITKDLFLSITRFAFLWLTSFSPAAGKRIAESPKTVIFTTWDLKGRETLYFLGPINRIAVLWLVLVVVHTRLLNQLLLTGRYRAVIDRTWVTCPPLCLGDEWALYFMILLESNGMGDGTLSQRKPKWNGNNHWVEINYYCHNLLYRSESQIIHILEKVAGWLESCFLPPPTLRRWISSVFFFLVNKKQFLVWANLLVWQVTLIHLYDHLLRGKMQSFNSTVFNTVFYPLILDCETYKNVFKNLLFSFDYAWILIIPWIVIFSWKVSTSSWQTSSFVYHFPRIFLLISL